MPAEIAAALWAELLKVRRSVVPWVTAVGFTVAGFVGAFFMFVLQDPARARSMGLIGDKAQLAGARADWAGYFGLTAQIVAVGGMLLFAVVVIWLFGREFSDRTAKDLLALPTSRSAVVGAKLLVALGWALLLTVQIVVLGLIFGAVLHLPGWSAGVAVRGIGTVFAAALLTFALATTYGLVASVGRGYLPAVGAMFVSLFAAQVIAAIGYGVWFPWSVPSLLSGVAGPDQAAPGPGSIAVVVLVGVAASVATARWWERADHNR
ncbi:ABC transporter permease [Pengzhenrongella sp.]|jgi:ABC-2 type transport system permease protein|uniref:ABC transporter permease n=1 Tax=Pengzhenrongella sp. TaxID=2888820 RepID=UPI002F92D0A9